MNLDMKLNKQAKQDAYNYFDEEYGTWEKKMHPVANNEPLIERAII